MEPFPSTTRIYSHLFVKKKNNKRYILHHPQLQMLQLLSLSPQIEVANSIVSHSTIVIIVVVTVTLKIVASNLLGILQRRLMFLLRPLKLKIVPWCHHHPSHKTSTTNYSLCSLQVASILVFP